jgi:DNA polymerase IV (DinB-like DNA polymerase)
MHFDLDYFFAQCEERENPDLKEKPLVVCVYSGRSEDSGAVSTANYVARKYGVKSGIPIAFAKRLLKNKDAVFLSVNFELYRSASNSVMEILRAHGESFEQWGMDEAFIEVTQKVKGDFEKAKKLAQQVKEEIWLKEKLTCSVGIGPNKLIAKIASDMQKPNGLTVVKPEEVKAFLHPLPVSKLVGVGRKTEEVLSGLGIKTVGELAEVNAEKLVEIFGKKFGVYLYKAARGIDETPVEQRKEIKSLSKISTLKQNTRELDVILDVAYHLCEKVHSRLQQHNFAFKSIGVVAVMQNMRIYSRSKSLSNPTNDLEVLKTNVRELFERLLNEVPELEVRRAGVRVASLSQALKKQRQLTEFA